MNASAKPDESTRLRRIRPVIEMRADLAQRIRSFFIRRGYLEVNTPTHVAAPANEDYIDAIPAGENQFLRTSPELHMKRLLAAGYDRIFQLGQCFRAGERGDRHLEEFTMLEWYRANAGYLDILDETIALLRYCTGTADSNNCTQKTMFNGIPVDWHEEWRLLTVEDAFKKYAGTTIESALQNDCYEQLLVEKIEPHLGVGRPDVLIDFPRRLAALAQAKSGNPALAERWELYAAGLELANCYSELTDFVEQQRRFSAAMELRTSQNRVAYPLDHQYMRILQGNRLPPCAGIALGFDRLLMLLTGAPRIQDVVTFPSPE